MPLLSQSDYAKHRGVSKQAIGKMVAGGKIPTQFIDGRRMIDAADADFALGESRARIDYAAPSLPLREVGSSAGLTAARTETEQYNAKLAELRYRREVGELIPVDQVTVAMERCAEAIVRSIEQLPAQADDLAAAFTRGGAAAVRAHLKEIGRRMRVTLADNMRLTAGAEAQDEGE